MRVQRSPERSRRDSSSLKYHLPDYTIGLFLAHYYNKNGKDEKAHLNPYMFVDTGIPALFNAAYRLGAKKHRIVLKVAGGSRILDEKGVFNIGKRNYTILRKILWKNGVLIDAEDTGGACSRTMYLDVGTGWVGIRKDGVIRDL